jgi:hypothetical protein
MADSSRVHGIKLNNHTALKGHCSCQEWEGFGNAHTMLFEGFHARPMFQRTAGILWD